MNAAQGDVHWWWSCVRDNQQRLHTAIYSASLFLMKIIIAILNFEFVARIPGKILGIGIGKYIRPLFAHYSNIRNIFGSRHSLSVEYSGHIYTLPSIGGKLFGTSSGLFILPGTTIRNILWRRHASADDIQYMFSFYSKTNTIRILICIHLDCVILTISSSSVQYCNLCHVRSSNFNESYWTSVHNAPKSIFSASE